MIVLDSSRCIAWKDTSSFARLVSKYGGPESPDILKNITLDLAPGAHGGIRRSQRLWQNDAH